MFKRPSSGVLGGFLSGKSSPAFDGFWTKRPFKPGDDPVADRPHDEAMSIVDVEVDEDDDDASSGAEDDDDAGSRQRQADDNGPTTDGRAFEFEPTFGKPLAKRPVEKLARCGYRFMKPVRIDDDQPVTCWSIIEAFSEDVSTHGVSHVLSTNGTFL